MNSQFDIKIYKHNHGPARTIGLLKDGIVFWQIEPPGGAHDFTEQQFDILFAEGAKLICACEGLDRVLSQPAWNDVKK